jgi:hypothetical protein
LPFVIDRIQSLLYGNVVNPIVLKNSNSPLMRNVFVHKSFKFVYVRFEFVEQIWIDFDVSF